MHLIVSGVLSKFEMRTATRESFFLSRGAQTHASTSRRAAFAREQLVLPISCTGRSYDEQWDLESEAWLAFVGCAWMARVMVGANGPLTNTSEFKKNRSQSYTR